MKERYFNREIDRILQNDVEIPREVEMKMEKALRQIGAKEIQKKKAKKSLRFQVALALAGAMILGTVTVGATGFSCGIKMWQSGLRRMRKSSRFWRKRK